MTNTTKEALVKSFKRLISNLPEKDRREAIGIVNALLKDQKDRDNKECKNLKNKQTKLL